MVPTFEKKVERVLGSSLPSTSGIVAELIKTIYNKSSGITDLAKIIEQDPSLSAKVLKIANSVYYGSSTKIISIRTASVVLGFKTIEELLTTIVVLNYSFDSRYSSIVDCPGLWMHSVGTATAAQLISRQICGEQSDVIYTLGLLHDIGKIILALYFPEQYLRVVNLAAEKRCRVILAERKLLNTDHTIIGKILCDLWNLPKEISSVILFHHDVTEAPGCCQMQVRIIALADYVCRRAKLGNPGDNLIHKPFQATLSILGNSPDKIRDNLEVISREFLRISTDIQEFFSKLDEESILNHAN